MKPRIIEKLWHFKSDIKDVFEVITDNTKYKWRSQIDKIDITNEKIFTEYTKDGDTIKCYITKKILNKEYCVDIESRYCTGSFSCILSETPNGETDVLFKEEIYINNPIIKFTTYLMMNIRKTKYQYMEELKERLSELYIVDLNKPKIKRGEE